MSKKQEESFIHFLDDNLNEIILYESGEYIVLNHHLLSSTEAKAIAYALLDKANALKED